MVYGLIYPNDSMLLLLKIPFYFRYTWNMSILNRLTCNLSAKIRNISSFSKYFIEKMITAFCF